MNGLNKFFHELFNPHCSHCERQRIEQLEQQELQREIDIIAQEKLLERERELEVCQSCINLKMELATAHQLTNKLLEKLTEQPKEEVVHQPIQNKVIGPSHIPWGIQRAKLEADSRLEANRLKALAENGAAKPSAELIENLEALESTLGIGDATTGTPV